MPSRAALRHTARAMTISRRSIGWIAGPALFLAVMLLPEGVLGLGETQRPMLAVLLLMIVWWVSEALPLAATAMLPLALYPLLGILPARDAAAPYANPVIFLFVGGFLVALAMQKERLHERFAAAVVLHLGTSPVMLVGGFIAATAFISMWVSNTATAMMMLPVGISVASAYGGDRHRFALSLFLGIAYAASIGGMATPIGTAPNAVMLGMYREIFPAAPPITFLQWMTAGVPVAVVLCLCLWGYFALGLRKQDGLLRPSPEIFHARLAELGPMSRSAKGVAAAVLSLCALWLLRADIVLGGLTFPGWGRLLPNPAFADDGTAAMAVALFLFVMPDGKGGRLLNWEWAAKLPWDVILLLGGGFALARGFDATGLDAWLGARLHALGGLPPVFLVMGVCLALIFVTEVSSNTAIASTVLPLLAAMAIAAHIHPLALMLPAAFACSCAFMLPTATPPNAIVFGSGEVSIPEMVRAGFALNLIAAVALTFITLFLINPLWGIVFSQPPAWLP